MIEKYLECLDCGSYWMENLEPEEATCHLCGSSDIKGYGYTSGLE